MCVRLKNKNREHDKGSQMKEPTLDAPKKEEQSRLCCIPVGERVCVSFVFFFHFLSFSTIIYLYKDGNRGRDEKGHADKLASFCFACGFTFLSLHVIPIPHGTDT